MSRKLLPVFLLAALLFLAAAGGAGAAEYTVDSKGDQVDEAVGAGGCKTAVATCTLRAALEESNASAGVKDTIKFSESFDGQVADTIQLATSLPTIVDRVRVQGFPSPMQCLTDYFGTPGPCVGVDGPAGGPAFRVAAERVVLIGFAITGAETGVEVEGGPGLEAWNDWFGIGLDGSAGALGTGVSIDQGSNGALLGGSSAVARNIFAHDTGAAIDVDGADGVDVRGSGFGVLPDGASLAANGKNIEITDAAAGENRVAKANWIGGTLTDAELASPTCDGACNVIAGALESGIDLVGDDPSEEPASGSTRIYGNYVGLDAFGLSELPNASQGVLVGGADNVTIGGPWPGDRNLLNGGERGVLAGPGAGNLTVEGNWVGLDPSGSESLAPPSIAGIAVEDGYQIEISRNRISMQSGTGIEQGGREATIEDNAIGEGVGGEDLPGGEVGIHLFNGCYYCNLVEDNVLSHAASYGLLIENDRNRVYGNRIEGAGAAGVRIVEPPPHGFSLFNEIGGDQPAEENAISGSGGAAIEIAQRWIYGATVKNVVARNHGALNGGPFVDLIEGANEEIAPPTVATATSAGASGTAAPEATIRVFRKAGSSPGEIASFLGEVVSDESGEWSVDYPSSLPGGTFVAVSQTTADAGTSELALASTPAPADEGGGGATPGPGPSEPLPIPALDTTPPQTFIVRTPGKVLRSPTARFRLASGEPGSSFECSLDGNPARKCRSPRTYRRVRPGKHVFRAWATDAAGNKDPTAATWRFRVLAAAVGGSA